MRSRIGTRSRRFETEGDKGATKKDFVSLLDVVSKENFDRENNFIEN